MYLWIKLAVNKGGQDMKNNIGILPLRRQLSKSLIK